jgi:uncharacterized protein YggU (UPF0235/DUF167 family)
MLLRLKVHAASRQASLKRKSPDSFEIWVKAPAERGLANRAALAALAAELGVPAARLHIVKGATSPAKIVKVLGEP